MHVTSPLLPDFDEFMKAAKAIWQSRRLTNNGPFIKEFERELCDFLDIPYISVMTNGTLPLLIALKAAGIESGEVITTPYSFVATAGAVKWMGLVPVFADVDPITGNLSPAAVERMITPNTRAILPVHVYGIPCDVAAFDALSKKYSLPVIYDAAHAFGVRVSSRSVLEFGDMSTMSFHATKVFGTIEGGALVSGNQNIIIKAHYMRNFGITGELTVETLGINAKMDELRAAYGLLNLKQVEVAIKTREYISAAYSRRLKNIEELRLQEIPKNVTYNYSHYPIFTRGPRGALLREELYKALCDHEYYPRRYFYPSINKFPQYSVCPGAGNVPEAEKLSQSVLCLPLSPSMTGDDVERICGVIEKTAAKVVKK